MNEPQPTSPLDELLKDPTLAGVRGLGLYRVLQERLKLERNAARRSLLEGVLAERRNFVEPITAPPGLRTLNGVGMRLQGEAERAADGSFIATLYFVVLFIPIFPFAQYLVSRASARSWYFHGKVPLSTGLRLWRRGVGLAALAAALVGAWTALEHYRHSDVYFVNGLDIPVSIRAGKLELALAGGEHEKRRLASGRYHVQVSSGGRALADESVELPGAEDAVAYNVLGAAPLFEARIPYHSDKAPAPNEEIVPRLFNGRSWIVEPDVDFVFTTEPKRIEMSEHATVTYRTRFDAAPGGWRSTVGMLMSQHKSAEAVSLAQAVALAEPDDATALSLASNLTYSVQGLDPSIAYGRKVLAATPTSIEAHRLYQSVMEMAGRNRELVDEYTARTKAEPGSAMWGYLLARVLPRAASDALTAELVERFPDDRYVRRGHAYSLLYQRRFGESLAQFEKVDALVGKSWDAAAEGHALALVGLGRAGDAAQLLARVIDGNPAMPLERLYAQVARLAGAEAPHPGDFYVGKSGASGRAWFASAVEGAAPPKAVLDAVENADAREALVIEALARRDLDGALTRLGATPAKMAPWMEPEVAVALAGELVRRGRSETAAQLLDGWAGQASLPSLKALILRGEGTLDLVKPDLVVRAAIELVQARRSRNAAERKRLLAEARADDLLQGAITSAAQSWRL